MSIRARTAAVRILVALGAVSALVGLGSAYLKREAFTASRFGDNAVEAVRADAVRQSLATSITDQLVARRPQLIAGRPVVESAVRTALASNLAGGIVSRAAVQTHNALFSNDQGSLVIDLANLGIVVRQFLLGSNPTLAAKLPDQSESITVRVADRSLTADLIRVGERMDVLAVIAPLLALGCFALALLATQRRRQTALAIGASLVVAAALAFILLLIVRATVIGDASGGVSRDVTTAVFDAFLRGFALWSLALGLAGALVAASAATLIGPVDPRAVPRRAWALATFEPQRPLLRALRAVALIAIGAFVIAERQAALALVAVAAGAYLVFVGLATLLEMIVGEAPPEELPSVAAMRRRAVPVAIGSIAVVAVAGLAIVLAVSGDGEVKAAPLFEGTGCNGHDELCDRRLDRIVFPSTHNSMASARAGFLNANQVLTMSEQLDLGIRGLLIDAYEGQRNNDGVVRTDLTGETRATVVAEIGEEGLSAAQRLAGSVAFGPLEGDKDTYLCHVLCELGATPAAAGLREIRDWLERHPREVLVIFIQDEIPPPPVKEAFEESGLIDFVSDYRAPTPFPTLLEMIDSGKRVLVMAEKQGEPTGWYHQGFVLAQDTPYKFLTPAELEQPSSCRLYRGRPDNPLFLVNHWVESYPPNPRNADVVNRRSFLLERARRCERTRHLLPNLLAVDFAERGEIVEATDRLNGVGGS
jgi:hypothetical protein